MAGVKGCGVTGAAGRDFHDPVGADPGLSDVLSGLNRYAEACGYGGTPEKGRSIALQLVSSLRSS
jgi:hypothetical protein